MFKDYGSFYMYVPEGYTGPLDAVIYYPSNTPDMGNERTETYPFEQYAMENQDKIVIINKQIYYDSDAPFEALSELQSSGEVQVGNLEIMAHSKTDTAAVKATIAATEHGYHVAHTSTLDSNGSLSRFNPRRDGEDTQGNGIIRALTPTEINQFANTGSMLVCFEQSGSGKSQLNEFINQLEPGNEVPMMYVTCKLPGAPDMDAWNRNHKSMVVDTVNGGYINVLDGTGSLELGGRIKEYTFETYDYSIGGWVSHTQEEAEQILASYGQSLSDYIPSTLPYNINNGSLVNISASDIEFNLDVAIGSLPSSDNLLVYRDELSAFLSSSMLSSLSNDASEANGLNSLISSFMTNTILKGDSWNMAYSKLGIYNEKLNARAAAAIELGDTLRNAISQLLGCMGEYDKIDTSELPELKATLEQLKSDLEILKSQLMKEVTYTDSKGDRYTKSEEDPEVRRRINEVNEEIAEIEKLIKVIEKLQATYNSVRPQLEAALAKVSEFSHEVASIEPSQVYTYVA